MIISKNSLRRETVAVLNSINAQIEEIEKEALDMAIKPQEMRDSAGNWVMSPLLLAKVQAIHTLVTLTVIKD